MLHDYVLIPVTCKGQTLYTTIDKEDQEWVSRYTWAAGNHGRDNLYVYRYEVADGQKKKKYLHRAILKAKPGEYVDHLNGDGLLNTKANLRVTDHQGNSMNRRKSRTYGGKPTKSKYKGVTLARNGMAIAYIRFNYELIHLGGFETEKEAARAYDEKAKELFGPFACLNF